MTINANMVMKLRGLTGAGMMECKKFLIATDGDIEQAIIEMRKAGQAKADNKANRIAAEGVIVIAKLPNSAKAVMVEVNSETDFVARDENFVRFANQVAETALHADTTDVMALSGLPIKVLNMTVEEARQALVSKIGENVKIRRAEMMSSEGGVVGSYLHGSKIGVLVSMEGAPEALAKDIAMHIAASRPLVIHQQEVASDVIERERDIFTAQARESGKPEAIIQKMIDGRISKFLDEVSLQGQPFVKDPNIKVGQLLKDKHAKVVSFVRFEVGEGITKKEDNFVEEVMAQVREQ